MTEGVSAISRARVVLASLFFSAASAFAADLPNAPSSSTSLAERGGAGWLASRIDAAWKVQRRWSAISSNGSFVYDFSLKTWNAAGKIKESLTREARVVNRGGEHRTEVLSATKDGRDVTADARAEENKRSAAPPTKKGNDFPSPFDPQFRDRYRFGETTGPAGESILSFVPRTPFDGAIAGKAAFDAGGGLRRVDFGLAQRPRFTRRLDFAIIIGADGLPERVESTGEVSLIVWKRRFESTLALRDIRAGGKEAP